MARTVAVAGKGGTGKTTISALVVRDLLQRQKTPVLAVDADPNANLHELLGIELHSTLGDVQADMMKNRSRMEPGLEKKRMLEYNIRMCLEEHTGFDFLAMGRSEGPGCYCSINNILRAYLDELMPNYEYVLLDNEAGMEHLSRRTTRDVDVMFFISDESVIGVRSAGRIMELSRKLEIGIRHSFLVINRAGDKLPGSVLEEVEQTDLELIQTIPYDEGIVECALAGESLLTLDDDNPAVRAVHTMMEQALTSMV